LTNYATYIANVTPQSSGTFKTASIGSLSGKMLVTIWNHDETKDTSGNNFYFIVYKP